MSQIVLGLLLALIGIVQVVRADDTTGLVLAVVLVAVGLTSAATGLRRRRRDQV